MGVGGGLIENGSQPCVDTMAGVVCLSMVFVCVKLESRAASGMEFHCEALLQVRLCELCCYRELDPLMLESCWEAKKKLREWLIITWENEKYF